VRRWDRLLDQYLEEYAASGRAAGTQLGVRQELERCGSWLKRRRPRPALEEVGSDLLIAYVRARSAFHAKSTLSGVMSKLRGWGEFLTRQGVWSSNPLRWMRGPRLDPRSPLPRRISRSALSEIWEAAAVSHSGYHRALWVALLGMFYGTGARRGEVERLDVSHWDRDEGLLRIDGRKTGCERRVPVPPLVWRCLEAYLPQRQNLLESVGRTDERALFVNKWGLRLTGRAISSGLQGVARRCGHERVTMHQFRHTCASDLLEDGVHLAALQQLLGHATIQTTMRYLHIADPQLHAGVSRHPINDMLGRKEDDR
jgi:site-specific recombinase XerD